MSKTLVLVTYRDRLTHLNCFVYYMSKQFPDLQIGICEQVDKGPWNKGLLYNAGYRELAGDYDNIILHDVDYIPDMKVDYSPCGQPTLLSTECSQYSYTHLYSTYFGGVIGITKEHYELVNGFDNRFLGYGGEDDNLRNRCVLKGLQPGTRPGNRFECFAHPKPDINPGSEYYNSPQYKDNFWRATNPDFTDGLMEAKYTIHSRLEYKECVHLRISTI